MQRTGTREPAAGCRGLTRKPSLPHPEYSVMLRAAMHGLSRRALQAADQPISRLMAQALANPQLISLAAGFVDQQSLPVEPTHEALDWLLSDAARARASLQYGTTPGYPPLRQQVLDRLRQADGQPDAERGLDIDQVVVGAGSNELLHLVTDTLCDPGDIVLCGAPSYFVYQGILRGLGARGVAVACDEEGMIPEAVEEELARREHDGELDRVKAIYIVTYFDNPSSVSLSLPRRARMVEIAKRWSSRQGKIHVIDDAAYRELSYDGADPPSLRSFDEEGDTVVLAQTFSKSYSPGIRVGWSVLPPQLVEPVCAQKGSINFGSPNFSQHLMSAVMQLGLLDPHVERLRVAYCEKRQAMLDAADMCLAGIPGVRWLRPDGGLYVWLSLPERIDTGPHGTLFDRAVAEGVLYVPGCYCYPPEGHPAATNRIRLSFGVQPPERIRAGIAALARAIEEEEK